MPSREPSCSWGQLPRPSRTLPNSTCSCLAHDLRLALRLIRRERWFATVAIGTVAIGIALSTAVFSVGKSLLVDALPYREAERATMVWVTNPRQGFDRDFTSYPRLLAWREHSQLIETFASLHVQAGGGDRHWRSRAAARRQATPEFFRIVHTEPVAGRLFAATEEHAAVVVLSHGLWQRKFGGQLSAVGQISPIGFGPATPSSVCCPVVSVPRTATWMRGSRCKRARRIEKAGPSGCGVSGD